MSFPKAVRRKMIIYSRGFCFLAFVIAFVWCSSLLSFKKYCFQCKAERCQESVFRNTLLVDQQGANQHQGGRGMWKAVPTFSCYWLQYIAYWTCIQKWGLSVSHTLLCPQSGLLVLSVSSVFQHICDSPGIEGRTETTGGSVVT